MGIGRSLHVGINIVDHSAFPRAMTLHGAENDAQAMCNIARQQGYTQRQLLLGSQANYESVEKAIRDAAGALKDGDTFLFTFAGHGCRKADIDGDEPDHKDETILLFDRVLVDDVLARDLWPSFREGVRVLMVSDSCNSGTLLKFLNVTTHIRREEHFSMGGVEVSMKTEIAIPTSGVFLGRSVSKETIFLHLEQFQSFYDEKLGLLPPTAPINASVLLLSACRDDEDAADGSPNGAFTQALLEVWDDGRFTGGYEKFRADIEDRLPEGLIQHPQLTSSEPPNPAFITQRPFTVPPP